MRGRVDLTSWNVLLSVSLPLFLSIYLPSTFIWCPSVLGSPSNPTAVPRPFCFLLTTVSFSTFAFPSPLLPLLYFYFFFYLQCLFLFVFDPCAGTSQPVTLLLWAWRVEMTPELWGSDLSLFLSTLSSSLIYPHSLAFSSLNISSSRGRPQRGH